MRTPPDEITIPGPVARDLDATLARLGRELYGSLDDHEARAIREFRALVSLQLFPKPAPKDMP